MTDTTEPITPRDFQKVEGVEDWRVLSEGACAFFRTESSRRAPSSCGRSAS